MTQNVGPITAEMIAAHAAYGLTVAAFGLLPIEERMLFRHAYSADVWHTEEEPKGSNRGPEVDRILTVAGAALGSPWCISQPFCYLIDSGGQRKNLPTLPASTHAWVEWAKTVGRILEKPQRACIGIIFESATTGHGVTISEVDGDNVQTIEGNTNVDGSREGYGTFRRVRPISEFHSFIRVDGA